MKRSLRTQLPVLIILLAGVALRLYQLGADSLWYDETVSTTLAGSPLPELIRHTAGDIHPPGYYLLLRAWLSCMAYPTGRADPFGHGLEFSAAFFSLFFGVLLIALAYALARHVGGRQVGRITAAITALSPFNVWYSQEVRMYTLGAALAGITLYALMRVQRAGDRGTRWVPWWWTIYALAAAAGMYTLYYFAFLLVMVNLWALVVLLRRPPAPHAQRRSDRLLPWVLANIGAAVLYAPWVPVAWRQATHPPVPPWRVGPNLWQALSETWVALSLGQSAPAWLWPVLALTLTCYGLGIWALAGEGTASKEGVNRPSRSAIGYLPVATFGSLALILALSAVTPLYHARYLFTYSPAFYPVLAAGIGWLWKRQRMAGWTGLGIWAIAAGITLQVLWQAPTYRADDHRGAVSQLREGWRPGDVVLVNAGYAYTALSTYWDGQIASRTRLTEALPAPREDGALVVVTTGHVQDDDDLLRAKGTEIGWGDPKSDFFALPASVAEGQIAALFDGFQRVWHYRIYDTVNDPKGVIRAALEENGLLAADQVFPGEAYMRLQLYVPVSGKTPEPGWPAARYANGLQLSVKPLVGELMAGETVYASLFWRFDDQPASFATSVRLIGPDGGVWAQPTDERPSGPLFPASAWPRGVWQSQTLALPLPAGTSPGSYQVELVVYDPVTGEHWPADLNRSDLPPSPNGLSLGEVTITRPEVAPTSSTAFLARFGPVALLEASLNATEVAPGGQIPVELLWQALEPPGEPLVIVLQLLGDEHRVVAGLETQPLNGRHPTQDWIAGELVRDRLTLDIPPDVQPAAYRLIVGVYRAADRQRLRTKARPFGSSDHWTLASVSVR